MSNHAVWGPSLFASPDGATDSPASDPMTDDEHDAAAAPPLAAVVNPVRRDDHVVLPATPQPPSSTSLWGSFRGPVDSRSLEAAASGQWPAPVAFFPPPDANSTSLLGTSQRRTPNAPIKTRNVYVGALPLTFTDADLTALLSEFGKVKSCRMFNTGARVAEIGRAYGFGLFEESGAAERAVTALDGKPLGNGRLQCQLSRNGVVKKPKSESPANVHGDKEKEAARDASETNPAHAGSRVALNHEHDAAAGTTYSTAPASYLPATIGMSGAPGMPAAFGMPWGPYGVPPPSIPGWHCGVLPTTAAAYPAFQAAATPVMTPNGIVWMRPV